MMDYWMPGFPIWEHYRKYFGYSVDEAKEKWFWRPFRIRWGFAKE